MLAVAALLLLLAPASVGAQQPVELPPAPPTGLQVDAAGDGLTVSWQTAATGSTPTRYNVKVKPDCGQPMRETVPADTLTATFREVKHCDTYTVWVRARNSAGTSGKLTTTWQRPQPQAQPHQPQPQFEVEEVREPQPQPQAQPQQFEVEEVEEPAIPGAEEVREPEAQPQPQQLEVEEVEEPAIPEGKEVREPEAQPQQLEVEEIEEPAEPAIPEVEPDQPEAQPQQDNTQRSGQPCQDEQFAGTYEIRVPPHLVPKTPNNPNPVGVCVVSGNGDGTHDIYCF